MSTSQDNLQILKKTIKKICDDCGRDAQEIKLIAVSKTFPISDILEILQTGHRAFGENKAQEIRDKMAGLADKDIQWHFIGSLQKNKVKYVAGKTTLIHSVESEKIAQEIDKRAAQENKCQDILVEVNVSGEENKHGLKPSQVADFVKRLDAYKHIRIIGLMTMAPLTQDDDIIRDTFSGLRQLRDELGKQNPNIKELSMGMTNDFKIAIEEGATFLRIGSAIFGSR